VGCTSKYDTWTLWVGPPERAVMPVGRVHYWRPILKVMILMVTGLAGFAIAKLIWEYHGIVKPLFIIKN